MEKEFSVIIAVYNTEKYIEETVKSVIAQSIGFEKNIEIILVNDGSTDNSKNVCMNLSRKYPKNIFYFEKSNGGPASAKNHGLKYANGRYISFLDSDDLLSEEALESVRDFFEKHTKKIDMVTLPIEYFEKKQGLHARYVKFNDETAIINLDKLPTHYVLSSAASVYKKEVFDTFHFDEKLLVAEDLYLNIQILLNNPRFGILSTKEAVYYYRKRHEQDSITNSNEYEDNWLIEIFSTVYSNIIRQMEEKQIKMPKFVKYIMLEEIIKRLKTPNFVSKTSLDSFFKISKIILADIESRLILSYPIEDYYILAMLLLIKYDNYNIDSIINIDDNNNVLIKNKIVENLENYSFKVSTLKTVEDFIHIEGYFNDVISKDFEIYCQKGNSLKLEVKKEEIDNIFMQRRFFDKVIGKAYKLSIDIPFTSGLYHFYITSQKHEAMLNIQNIYGEDTVFINSEYVVEKKKYNVKMNNRKLFIRNVTAKEEKNGA